MNRLTCNIDTNSPPFLKACVFIVIGVLACGAMVYSASFSDEGLSEMGFSTADERPTEQPTPATSNAVGGWTSCERLVHAASAACATGGDLETAFRIQSLRVERLEDDISRLSWSLARCRYHE